MKTKIYTILLLFTISNVVQSQTKSESQVWIKSTIENYVNKEMYRLLNIYYFDDGKSIVALELISGEIHYKKMFLKEINQITILAGSGGYVMRLSCAYKKSYCCETGIHASNGDGTTTAIPNKDFETGITIYLDKGLKDENMIERLKKGIAHLVALNGGKIISNTF